MEMHSAMLRAGFEFDSAAPKNTNRLMTVGYEQFILSMKSRKYKSLYCPANMAPLFMSDQTQLIFTLHCLRFHYHPENYSSAFVRWYRFAIPRLLSRADSIVTVSKTAANEIADVYPQSIGKTQVVYPGVSDTFCVEGERGDQRIGERQYFVYIGNASPAKNLKLLLEAFELIKGDSVLVLIGVDQSQLDSMKVDYSSDRVIPLGYIESDITIASILRGAQGLLAPSMYESFDLPTVEAMGCGCPVIASDTSVHHEICEKAGIFLSANDSQTWADTIDKVCANTTLSKRLKEIGLLQAKRFSWDTAATQIIKIINGKPF